MESLQKTTGTEVAASILLAATGGVTRESLCSNGEFTFDQVGRYIFVLLNSGMLVDQFGSLMTTEKGLDFIKLFVYLEHRASG